MDTQQFAEQVCAEWADRGLLIEGGWQAMIIVAKLQNAPAAQLREMRRAYMLGAQHLFASILCILEEDAEPTEKDLHRVGLIHAELEAFRRSLDH